MIDKKMEPMYDTMISIFLGIVIIIMCHIMFNRPRIIYIKTTIPNSEKIVNKKCDGCI